MSHFLEGTLGRFELIVITGSLQPFLGWECCLIYFYPIS